MMPLMLFGFMQMLVNAALWGIAAYLIFVLIAPDQKRFQTAAWISAVIYFFWDEVIGSGFLSGAGVCFTNRDVSRFVGDDFASVDFFDVLLSVGLAYGGFYLGRYLFRRVFAAVQSRASSVATVQPPVLQVQSGPEPKYERTNNMTELQQTPSAPSSQPAETAQSANAPQQKKKTGLATASLVCGICGLAYPTSILFLASIAGIICGHMATRRIREKPDEYDGPKRAKAGLIISYIALALGLILGFAIGFMRASINQSIQQMGY